MIYQTAVIAGLFLIATASMLRLKEVSLVRREIELSKAVLESVLSTLRDRL